MMADWRGIPSDLRALIEFIRDNPETRAYMEAAQGALARTVDAPRAELEQWMQPVFECVEGAIDTVQRELRTPVAEDRGNLRRLIYEQLWKTVFPGAPFPVEGFTPMIQLWPGMRSIIGIQDGMITAPRIDPNELPQVKRVIDEMTSSLRQKAKRGPKERYKSAARLRLDIRAAVTALRNSTPPRPVTKRAVAGMLPKQLSEDALVVNAKRLGIDLDAELDEVV